MIFFHISDKTISRHGVQFMNLNDRSTKVTCFIVTPDIITQIKMKGDNNL